jgi:hypothetical protein
MRKVSSHEACASEISYHKVGATEVQAAKPYIPQVSIAQIDSSEIQFDSLEGGVAENRPCRRV